MMTSGGVSGVFSGAMIVIAVGVLSVAFGVTLVLDEGVSVFPPSAQAANNALDANRILSGMVTSFFFIIGLTSTKCCVLQVLHYAPFWITDTIISP
ncbi:hypothetical protein D3C73_673890 [compost metagenome]